MTSSRTLHRSGEGQSGRRPLVEVMEAMETMEVMQAVVSTRYFLKRLHGY